MLAPRTRKAYQAAWVQFNEFLGLIDESLQLPVSTHILALYIVHLKKQGLRTTTVRTLLSPITYMHKMLELTDPVARYPISRLLAVYKSHDSDPNTRRPFSLTNVSQLFHVLHNCVEGQYDLLFYQALFSLLYAACLHVGELLMSNDDSHALAMHQLSFITQNGVVQGVKIHFLSYKYSKGSKPTLFLEVKPYSECPVLALLVFLHKRGNAPGKIFVDSKARCCELWLAYGE